jgi:Prolyl oligopeptidase family/Sulfatase-modifying factor enzyme 1
MAPLYQFDKVRTPTLIFQGEVDRVVPVHHAWTQYRALQELGKADVRLVLFPGEKHSLKKYVHQRRKLEEELAWFDKYLFKTAKSENEALKSDSPLARALKLKAAKRDGSRYGFVINLHPGPIKSLLVPETVKHGKLQVGRFEVTRAQFAMFDRNYVVESGTDNYPANGITFEQAKGYCAWLSKQTGESYRLPNEEEGEELYEKGEGKENTLDYWAGYAVNPDDAKQLRDKVKELGGKAPLLREGGSFQGVGEDEMVFDLGGNVAEWVETKDGKGELQGGSADRPADAKQATNRPGLEYQGFRVVKEK